MSNQGDDCYFYFYSTCTKGDSCPFRHCEAALGNETVCTLWEEGRCYRQVCKFRHTKIDKKRSEIPCYWENQLSGCRKANCAFHHTRGRYVDGIFLAPSKCTESSHGLTLTDVVTGHAAVILRPEPVEEEVKAAQLSVPQNKLVVPANSSPQLRGVMKVESSDNVPSPTHPPVVINAADDDEDDDDQYSEEGEESKVSVQQLSSDSPNGLRIVSTRKSNPPKRGDALNFGIKSLEEIKSKKQKEKGSRQSAHSIPSQSLPGTEKENLRTVVRTVTLCTKKGEEAYIGLNLTERLGKRRGPSMENPAGKTGPVLKRSLAERLGRKVESPEKESTKSSKQVQVPRSVKERLDLPIEQKSNETETATKPAGEIRIKTLEEILLEKASQKREQEAQPLNETVVRAEEPSVVTKVHSAIRIKSFSEVLAEKKQRQLEEEQQKTRSEKPPKLMAEVMPKKPEASKVQLEKTAGKAEPMDRVRVKTLDEIKRDKALRVQQNSSNEASQGVDAVPTGRKRLLRITKPAVANSEKLPVGPSPSALQPLLGGDTAESLDESTSFSNPQVQVKSFEEIMREKRQRKQQEGEQLPKEKAVVPPALFPAMEEDAAKENTSITVKVSAETAEALSEPVATRSLPTVEAGDSKLAAVRRGKGKAKRSGKACVTKNGASTKGSAKRKAPKRQPHAAATVEPLSSDSSAVLLECPAKKLALAAVEERSVAALAEEGPVAVLVSEMPKASSESPVSSQAASMPQTEMSSPTLVQASIKSRRLSSTSGGKPAFSMEDDFEKLMWEISGGKLEAEIDLDPGKDEDDLLLELSEMIDS
ncbi:zinc finger CCCH domain-containing protein 11A isoform X2 [Rhinatrema bivittatum]|uniref:zinc finger CCCH domain-containing protein 11A isoform X2 n=1 Tax=Rhinatrema bivittatum TaxID=194408 RepID=UPI00112985AE|nr:zinc finger CCCH domain-containing protein 11A isoform X2 [Rhinatrema bivittatum]